MTRPITLAGYVLLVTAVATNQALALRLRRTATLGQAVATLRRSRTGRLSLLATWLWLGWHLFVRANY
jgi:type II secretory pathway component PulJ